MPLLRILPMLTSYLRSQVVNRGLQVMEELKLRLRADKYQPPITATLENLANLHRQILSKAPSAPSRPPPKERTEETWTDPKDAPEWRKRWWRLELISKLRLGMEEANARDNAAKKVLPLRNAYSVSYPSLPYENFNKLLAGCVLDENRSQDRSSDYC